MTVRDLLNNLQALLDADELDSPLTVEWANEHVGTIELEVVLPVFRDSEGTVVLLVEERDE